MAGGTRFELAANLKLSSRGMEGKWDAKNQLPVALLVSVAAKASKATPITGQLPKHLAEFVDAVFSGPEGQHPSSDGTLYRLPLTDGAQTAILVKLPELNELSLEDLRSAAAQAARGLAALKVPKAQIIVPGLPPKEDLLAVGSALSEGVILGLYNFNIYRKEKKKSTELNSIEFITSKVSDGLTAGIARGQALAECVNYARHLGDRPGNLMTPTLLASETQRAAKGTGLKVTVWGKDKIAKAKMGCFLGVSLGSSEDPKLIIMEYSGAAKSKKPICYVGKGLTFDSGGISIKPSAGMEEMKFDMCGGANVIGTMLAIARLKLKVNAIGIVPATENMPGPSANKPGDICFARNGISVEVNNTDAEGRLILADALVYASEQSPQFIVDAATLTGAMSVALGNVHTGFFARDEELAAAVHAAAERTGERVWRMPMTSDHLKDMKGTYADLSNVSSGKGAGSATAAAFLGEFVDKKIPWAHFDIAGTAWHTGGRLNHTPKKGASGVMIRTFVELARQYQ